MRASTLILLLLTFVPRLAQAQDDPRVATGSEYLARPNELGINLAPAAIFLLRGSPVQPRFAIAYKHLFETKTGRRVAWRAGAEYIADIDRTEPDPFETSLLESRTGNNEVRLERHDSNVNLAGFAGLEFRMKRGNVYVLSGLDIFYRQVALKSVILRKEYEIDPTGNIAPKQLTTEQREQITSAFTQTGVRPFLGLLFRASRRLSFALETGFSASYTFGHTIEDTNKKLETRSVSVPDVNIRYIVRDFSLYYRF